MQQEPAVPAHRPAVRNVGLHVLAYLAGMLVLAVLNLAIGEGWWSFWSMLVWTVALVAHLSWVIARDPDESWVRDREIEVKLKSYDLGHMAEIEKSFEQGTFLGKERPKRDD